LSYQFPDFANRLCYKHNHPHRLNRDGILGILALNQPLYPDTCASGHFRQSLKALKP
jgi:hypothetical protein